MKTITELNALPELLRRAQARAERTARRQPQLQTLAHLLALILFLTTYTVVACALWRWFPTINHFLDSARDPEPFGRLTASSPSALNSWPKGSSRPPVKKLSIADPEPVEGLSN